jgi:ribosomal protein S18 acetylase RimI-like enzyme
MTAQSALSPGLEIIDLRRMVGRELDPLLLEETGEWRDRLDWDFARSAELIRHFADERALTGAAVLERGEVIGYGYSVLEDRKGLIGDLYVRREWRGGDVDARLFGTVLDQLIETPRLERIESQLMLLDPAVSRRFERERSLQLHERMMMGLECAAAGLPARRINRRRFHFEPWADHHHEAAAAVIALAYRDHIDGRINDQYLSVPGARRFIYNVVQYPGCGAFCKAGSVVAFDLETGWLAGMILTSFVGPETGHITQVCVAPRAQGTGLGYELMSQGIAALREAGAKRVTLTVTAENESAVGLYRMCGFQEMRRFFAFVWEA